jgi:hypothetical protein
MLENSKWTVSLTDKRNVAVLLSLYAADYSFVFLGFLF